MTLRSLFEKTVFLLGAGASMDADCLSSRDMLVDLKKRIQEMPPSDNRREPFQGIHDFIIASLHYQYAIRFPNAQQSHSFVNIEDFVMVLRQLIDREFVVPQPLIANWNEKITAWEIKHDDVFRRFLEFVTGLLVDNWTRHSEEKARDLVEPVRALMELSDGFKADFFSLNYDLVWEKVFNTSNEKLVENGFSKGRWTGEFEDEHSPIKLTLSKLHGSVDWFFDAETEEVKISDGPVGEPLIIFGSSYKMQSFDPFISLLSRFRQRLQSSTLYVIIGYSFHDRYINNILIQSLSSQLIRSAVVVDPCAWESSEDLAAAVEKTQNSKSLDEMLNLKRINPRKIEIVKMTTKQFYREYFANNAEILRNKLQSIEQEEPAF